MCESVKRQTRTQGRQAHDRCNQPKFAHAIDIIRIDKPGSIGDRAALTAMLTSQIDVKDSNGEVQRGIYLPELWSTFPKMAGAMSRLRRMELFGGRGLSCNSRQTIRVGAGPAEGCLFHVGRRVRARATPADDRFRRTRSR